MKTKKMQKYVFLAVFLTVLLAALLYYIYFLKRPSKVMEGTMVQETIEHYVREAV